ncbi:MAG: tetratricopeptide repeat protein [Nitrospirae bacterium]|nr:MAG: tetratricopeptide repeat protein [Nitrospirota bacterium]
MREALAPTAPLQADPDRCEPALAGLVGVDPIRTVVMMEEHDGAYCAWKQAGLKDRIVVHIDAHIDFRWIPERDLESLLSLRTLREVEDESSNDHLWNFTGRPTDKLINVGNYLNPALREGHLRSLYWVVPDGFFATRERREQLETMLYDLEKSNPRALQRIAWTNGALQAELYGKPLTICLLSQIPRFEEVILLDIDTDFLIIKSVSPAFPFPDLPDPTPWIWPEELVERLRERQLRSDCVTVAYSVEGGYTPLGYKYLADDLASLLRDPDLPAAQRRLMSLKREAASAHAEGKYAEAREKYERALPLKADDASVHYRLAQLAYEQGHGNEARMHYEQAITLDPTYRTEYNNLGPVYLSLGQVTQAAAEYRKIIALDPQHASAHRGLGDLSVQQERWDEALAHYRRASELRPDDARARLGHGRAQVHFRNWTLAETELMQAVGSTQCEGAAQYWLGYVYTKQRRWDDALAAYKAARRCRFRTRGLYLALGHLYLRKGNLYQATRHYGKAARFLGADLRHRVRHLPESVRRMLTTIRHGHATR